MEWYRVEDVAEYRLTTKALETWLKGKWGDFDYNVLVRHYYGGFSALYKN